MGRLVDNLNKLCKCWAGVHNSTVLWEHPMEVPISEGDSVELGKARGLHGFVNEGTIGTRCRNEQLQNLGGFVDIQSHTQKHMQSRLCGWDGI